MSVLTDQQVPVPTSADGAFVRLDGVVKHFPVKGSGLLRRKKAAVHAVDGVSLSIEKGETLGLVGESGCGKSTLARLLTGLYPIDAGKIHFDGRDITNLSRRKMRPVRRDVQMIFQDPYGSLNPRRRVGSIIGDPFSIHRGGRGEERKTKVQELMEVVGLNPEHFNRFPAEFSGGQRQRIGIARALALRPKLIVCDEPVSALDVSIQAQVINLLADLQSDFGLTYLFIAHDLSVVRHVSTRVAVMYLGKIVEIGQNDTLYEAPSHPYTAALLSAVPVPDPDRSGVRQRVILRGDVPSPISPPSGCRFHTRCPKAQPDCVEIEPELAQAPGRGDLSMACLHPVAIGEDLSRARATIDQSSEAGIDAVDADPAADGPISAAVPTARDERTGR